MTTHTTRWALMALSTCAALVSTSAHAVWTFNTTSVSNIAGSNAGDTSIVSLSGVSAANTNGVVNGAWASSTMVHYGSTSGFGVTSDGTDTPNHAVDNVGRTEGVLLRFSASTVLTSIGLGYTSNGVCKKTGFADVTLANDQQCSDLGAGWALQQNGSVQVDMSVFRWTGTGTPTGSPTPLVGQTATSMAGWELVGNYGDMITDTGNPYNVINTSNKTSSWWLISAYNSGFATTSNSTNSIATETRNTVSDNGGDYFKLFAVAGSACTQTVNSKGVCGGSNSSVPEPATLALTSVALLGVVGLRRRQVKSAASV